jgi:small subunit ribosomal protein S16
MGAKKHPFYRIVVTDKDNKRDGRFVEILGYYNPCRTPIELKLDKERVGYWMQRGAQPSLKVKKLIKTEPTVKESQPASA